MPVKNSIETARETIHSIIESDFDFYYNLTIYNDFSDDETTAELKNNALKHGVSLVNISDLTTHPSPNYLLILQKAQAGAVEDNAHLIIVESDVIVGKNTFQTMAEVLKDLTDAALVATITVDEKGKVNFPYLHARHFKKGVVKTKKRLSFCCTLLTNSFLNAYNFGDLNPEKTWFDVFLSHKAIEMGFSNYLITSQRVIHKPHGSRPWKRMKYSNPLKYYWQKITQRRDRI